MADKRISQLNSHTTPSGSDLLVIVNNNETKKITYADLKDSIVINSDNALLNAFSASYLNDSASFHTRINDATNEQDLTPYVTNIVYGVLSGSVDSRLDNVELFTQSIDSRVDSLESWSSSLDSTFATDLQVSIVSSSVAATIGVISQNTGLLSTSSFNEYTASQSTGSLVDRLNSIENVTSSYELKGSGILSGSVSYTDLTNIPSGIVSQSTDIANFTFTTDTITNGAITLHATNSDIVLDADGDVYLRSANAGNGIVTDGYLAGVIGDTNTVNNSTGHTITDNLTNIINSIPTIPVGTISGSEQITALGFISSSQTIDTGSLATTGSNIFNGNQTINGSLTLSISNGIPTGVTNWVGQGGWNQGFYSNLATTGGTGTGLTVDVAAGGAGYISINEITINTPGNGYSNGDIITIDNENNLPGTFTLQVGASSLQFNSSSVEFHDLTLNGTGSFQSDLTVYGNLKVWGTQSIINSTNVELSDNILYLAPSGGGDYDLGIVGHYNDGTYSHTGIFSDASDGHAWKVFKGLTAESSGAFIDTNGVGYTLADFKANNIYGGIYATNGVISGSSQLTSSFDTRYTLSGSVSSTPAGTISGSSQLTASFDTRYLNTGGDGVISGSSQLTSSFDSRYSLSGSVLTSFSSSVDNRLDVLEASIITGSMNYTQVLGNRRTGITSTGTSIISGSITTTGNPVQIMVTGDANPIGGAGWARLQIFRDGIGIGNIIQVENSSNLNVPYCLNVIDTPSAGTYTYSMRTVDSMSGTFDFGEFNGPVLTAVELKSNTQLPSGLISGSSQLTSSYDTRYTLSGSVQPLPSGLISGSSQVLGGSGIYSSSAQLPSGLISGSSQLPSGLISGSSQLPSGIVSGSSQLTASYDTRYTLSGSVVNGTTPAGTISGSSQLTSSFDGRYTLTSSFNSFTASAQAVTTGSNSFNGNQTITGSLTVTNGNVIASQITANTSSLYLTSGSNLYVQNNGIVEITGSLKVSGSTNLIVSNLQIGTGSGDEGGEIQLAKAVTNTTLTGSAVTVDVYRDRVRIFEQGGDARGVHIDLSKAPGGVAGELMWKASGLVNAGVDVTLGNLKARLASSGNYSLQVSTIVGTYSVYGSSVYSYNGIGGVTLSSPLSITTTPTYLAAGYNFLVAGSTDTWIITDTSVGISWRISLMIGPSFTNNMITIERLY